MNIKGNLNTNNCIMTKRESNEMMREVSDLNGCKIEIIMKSNIFKNKKFNKN